MSKSAEAPGGDAFPKELGRTIAEQRRKAGLSQEEVGFGAELHRTEIGMVERGVRIPRADTLVKLAGAIGVKPGVFLDHFDWTPRQATKGGFRIPPAPPTDPPTR